MNLSITKAWDETAAFVKQEGSVLFLIAFGLAVLPNLILQAVGGRVVGPGLQTPSGTTPDLRPLLSAAPLLLALFVPVFLLGLWGNLTINVLALRQERVIGSAFGRAARRILPLLGATLLYVLAGAILLVPMIGAIGFGIATQRAGLTLILFLVVWALLMILVVRLLLTTPVAAAESLGPIGIIRRSWELTAGHFWKLFGFLLMIGILFAVIILAVDLLGGLLVIMVAGQPQPGSVASFLVQLLAGLVQAAFVTCFGVLVARIYAQLAGNMGSVAEVFE
ncbi:MAG TPA: glycerophosphoryl diester phosphodiesterase membrane domain-containing protein [Allosphingosinicella sp.]|nr:glycerophosphoryl diester phosphodiesterase membrane domain-containing protein [Allosphingosinicella sp.]